MKIEILGCVQDGGVPHLGCKCDVCQEAYDNPEKKRYSASILLKENNDDDTVRYLIDATPDIREQIKGEYIDGIFVPNEGIGHILGLIYFGHEGPDASDLNVYTSESVEEFIMKNDPFRYLVDRGNIEIHNFNAEDSIDIQGGSIENVSFYHTHFNHDTSGYMIKGDKKKAFYLSDAHEITEELEEKILEADIAIIDGTFWNEKEIDRFEQVPHPTIQHLIEKFEKEDTEIYFTHLNHTNPVLKEDSEEREKLEEKGFNIAEKGTVFQL